MDDIWDSIQAVATTDAPLVGSRSGKKTQGPGVCQQSLLDSLSSQDEDVVSDSAELPCVFQVGNVRERVFVKILLPNKFAHCCSVVFAFFHRKTAVSFLPRCDNN